MVNKFAASLGAFIAAWLFAVVVVALVIAPTLISKYSPPFVDFVIDEYNFDDDGAMVFVPTFTKRWCVYQRHKESWFTLTNGVSERVGFGFVKEASGNPNRPPGKHRGGEWKVDLYVNKDATEHYGQLTHHCLWIFRVQTKVGPFPIP